MTRIWMAGTAVAVVAAVSVAAGQAPAPAHKGTVVDTNGRPIQGAALYTFMEQAVTDAAGRFAFIRPLGRVRLTADGYQPLLLEDVDLARPVMLRPATAPPRLIPRCDPAAAVDGLDFLFVHTPDGVTVSRRSYDHEFYLTWSRGGAALRHGYGPHMTDGLPTQLGIAGLRNVEDRDLRLAVDAGDVLHELRLTDYRGVRPNGTHYRYVGKFFEYFEYDGESAADAAFFDRMLDAMCYRLPVH